MSTALRSQQSEIDVYEIAACIARDNIFAACAMMDSIEETLLKVAAFPVMGRPRPELGKGLRGFPLGEYVIFYRPSAEGVELVRVRHGARKQRAKVFKRL